MRREVRQFGELGSDDELGATRPVVKTHQPHSGASVEELWIIYGRCVFGAINVIGQKQTFDASIASHFTPGKPLTAEDVVVRRAAICEHLDITRRVRRTF